MILDVKTQSTSLEVWDKKYRLRDNKGDPVDRDESDTRARVAKALASVESTSVSAWEDKFRWAMDNGAIPAGRIMSNAGASQYKPATSLINCLAGGTPVMTRGGIVPISTLTGGTHEILNGDGEWISAPFKSFGIQDTYKVTLRWGNNKKTTKDVFATKDHRWFLDDGRVITTEFWLTGGLKRGFTRIPHLFVPHEDISMSEYNDGIIHGMVYGDGSLVTGSDDSYVLNLCGEKQELTGLVQSILSIDPHVYNEGGLTRFSFKNDKVALKGVPVSPSVSYLKGFLAGVLATDGSVSSSQRSCYIYLYGDKELIDFINDHSAYCGVIPTFSRKSAGKGEVTNYGARNKDLWVVGLHPSTVDESDVLRTLHKENFFKSKGGDEVIHRWHVVSVDHEPVRQEVFCCHELKTTAFCLFNGMKTGQCTVADIVDDSMNGILTSVLEAGLTLKSGCGIGYEFSTLRPKGAYVSGAGAYTSGPLSFMDIFDKMCFTVSSAGGRRGAQMATFAIWHPDILEFITAKREDGRLRQFNLSLLIDDEFISAVRAGDKYDLIFPVTRNELKQDGDIKLVHKKLFWEEEYCKKKDYLVEDGKILCKVYSTVSASELWDTIMQSTYDFAEPGFLLIGEINKMNNNWFCEEIRATNPCGEQPLSPHGSCLLGSVNLTKMIDNPLTQDARFNWERYKEVVKVFTRMLDNVVEIANLPLKQQQNELVEKRRHGMGFLGLGSALTLLGMEYGSEESVRFTEEVMKQMAVTGMFEGVELAKEKGCAPILDTILNRKFWLASGYMERLLKEFPSLEEVVLQHGCRFTHHTSIAPTGTISLALANNVSNGIEPTFAHKYTRNIIKEGKNSKEAVEVYSYEMLVYKGLTGSEEIPLSFSTTDTVTPKQHVDIQAAAQKWCDSSISKTINVPTDIDFEEFKGIYMYAYEKGLKGCTTFRFNPEAFQGVLVKEEDLANTLYTFELEDGGTHTVPGNQVIVYDGEEHTAANLYDALKEGYYGKF